MNLQIIQKEGQPWVQIPLVEYQQLLEAKEELEDIQDFDEALANPQETIPLEWIGRLIHGEPPVRVWREYRGLTQPDLAKACEVTLPEMARIETGEPQAPVAILQKIAKILKVEVEDLLGNQNASYVLK
jgi:DNA-binding XRE family transcriptional regulator